MRAATRLGFLLLATATPFAFAADEVVPTGKLPDDVAPVAYTLNFKIDPREEKFSGKTTIRIKLAKPSDHVWLHGEGLTVSNVAVTDAAGKSHKATYTAEKEGVAKIGFDGSLPAQEIQVAIEYTAPFNDKLEGLYKVKVDNDAYAMTQMEAISARNAFPGFDEPRFKTPFDITLTVPADDAVMANTLPKHEEKSSDGKWKTVSYTTTKPLPTYLVAWAVGPWDVVDAPPIPPNSVRKNPVPLRGISPRGTGPQLKWILAQTADIVKYYEEYTNIPYPWDKLDLLGAPDFSAGAMENAGLITFRDALLRTDGHTPADTFRSAFNVTSHEVAHQWFGDLVTVPWWDDIWLNESFATWAQGKETVALRPQYQGELERLDATRGAMGSDSLLSARKIRQPINDHGDIENAFDGITYEKGAAVLRMFEEWLGEDTFRSAMREYLKRHSYGSGSSNDLISTIAEVSKKGDTLAKAMRSFLDQPGLPLVNTELTCSAGKASITMSQARYLPFGVMAANESTWSVPVCARFGKGGSSATQCFLLEQAKQTFPVESGCADWYLPNANASGYYRFSMNEKEFSALGKTVDTLQPSEQVIYADAIASSFRRGEASPAQVLEALPVLAKSDHPQVATALIGTIDWLHEYLANKTTLPVLDAYVTHIYGPILQKVGYRKNANESSETTQMREDLANFLALGIKDPVTRKALDAQGRAALGLDGGGKVDLSKADSDLLRVSLKVTVQEGGQPAFDAIMNELKTNHQTRQRYTLLAALASTHQPELSQRALDYGLTPAVAVGEMRYIYGSTANEPEDRAGYWQWFKTNFDKFQARMPPFAQGYAPAMASLPGKCSKDQAEQLRAFFEPHIKQMNGGERVLAQVLESTNQCAALREHVGEKALESWAETQAKH
ncbi:MAG TPA: M1 family metallopeptidase [Rudaea sp.]|jgi:alanyl aminopeptidase|nr:M1 family metallopeptidase [Rudaea sp.]